MTSRYSIAKEKFGSYTLFTLQDHANGGCVSVLPEFGGLINSIKFSCRSKQIEILDGYLSPEELPRDLKGLFKGCSLFPFPNRVNLGRYCFAGKDHFLPLNFPQEKNAIHGLVFDKKFQVKSYNADNEGCLLELAYLCKGLPGYPFSFEIVQRYCLDERNGLSVKNVIENRSSCTIPVGQGWHPYFNLGASTIDTLHLKIPGNSVFEMDERNIPTNKMETFDKFSTLEEIGSSIFDNCFRVQGNEDFADTLLLNKCDNTLVRIRQQTGDKGYNYLQIFTPPSRASIAIEPMSCAPDAFNNGVGLIQLERGDSVSLIWEVNLFSHEEV